MTAAFKSALHARLGRALLGGVAIGAALATLDVAAVRLGYVSRGERALLCLGVSLLLLIAGALGGLALGALDEIGRLRSPPVRAAIVALATAVWWGPVAAAMGASRALARRLPLAAAHPWLFPALSVIAAALVAALVARQVLTLLASSRGARFSLAALGALLAIGAFLVDALVWRRLHPEAHAGLCGLACASLLAALALVSAGRAPPRPRAALAWGIALLIAVAPCALALRSTENVWFVAHSQTATAGQVLSLLSRALPSASSASRSFATRRTPQRRSASAATLDAPLPASPDAHLVLITVDALRPDHTGAWGYSRRVNGEPLSPALDALAARAVRFERAYSQAPHSAYSIASLLGSEYVHSTVRLGLPTPPTLAELLAAQGWRTECWFPMGLFFDGRRELADFAERRFGFERATTTTLDAPALTDDVLRRLEEIHRDGEPRSFLWVHYFDVHEPYVTHPGYDLGATAIDRYDSEIAFFDRELARLVAKLQTLDRPTVIALTADHGEEFFEHGGWYHGSSLYEEQVRVPLLVIAPGVAPRVVRGPVELVDLAPTLMELLGERAPPSLRGDDLGAALVGAAEPMRPVYSEIESKRMVVEGGWKLIHDVRRDTWELYSLVEDPRELVNRYDKEPARARQLAAELDEWIDGIAAERAHPEAPAIVRARLGDRGAVPELARLLLDPRRPEAERAQAARLAGALEGYAAKSSLRVALADERLSVRAESALALGELTDRRATPTLVKLLDEKLYRRRAAVMLGRLRDVRAEGALLEIVSDRHSGTATPASSSGEGGDGDLDLRRKAIHYLGFVGGASAIAPLTAIAPELRTRYLVALALARIGQRVGDASVEPLLADLLARETYEDDRAHLVAALGFLGDTRGVDPARRAALADPPVKWAGETLVRLGALHSDGAGKVWGVDFAPESELAPAFHDCVRAPPPPGGESIDDFAARTRCTLSSTGDVQLRVARSGPARTLLRVRPVTIGARLSLSVDGVLLPLPALVPGWQELALEGAWSAGAHVVTLAATGDVELDHLLVLARD